MPPFDLPTVWFMLIAFFFTLYFFLEGFDFGVDLLRPLLARNDAEERALVGTIGPLWHGNAVWVLLGAGVMFSVFPLWYGTLFTALYLVFIVIVLALIGRGVAFEFRNQYRDPRWTAFWDFTSFVGSFIPSFLWGVIMANLVRGLPLDADGDFVGGFWDIFDLFSVMGGLSSLLLFMLHGATFLLLRLHTGSVLYTRARRAARFWGALATAATFIFVSLGYVTERLFENFGLVPWLFPIAAFSTLASIWYALAKGRDTLGFVMSGLTIVFSTATIFLGLYPNVLPSTLAPEFTLTVYNSASQPYTLRLTLYVSALFLPLIIGYQVYNYYVFRQRVREEAGDVSRGH